MRKKRKTRLMLPRLTVLSYSNQDLLRFAGAVQQLPGLVADLLVLRDELRAAQVRSQRASKANATRAHLGNKDNGAAILLSEVEKVIAKAPDEGPLGS